MADVDTLFEEPRVLRKKGERNCRPPPALTRGKRNCALIFIKRTRYIAVICVKRRIKGLGDAGPGDCGCTFRLWPEFLQRKLPLENSKT